MDKITIKVSDITKIKEFADCVIVYTPREYWVCEKDQDLPKSSDIFLTLNIKKTPK